MGDSIELELHDGGTGSPAATPLPANIHAIGEIDPSSLKVYIKQDVYRKIENLSAADTGREVGSILIGEYAEELGKIHVVISHCIEAKYTDSSASTLTFTHRTWEYVHSEQQRLYPELKIVGWQHTHPNYGVFLSNYDVFIQENFFNLPFQTAYVVDPVQNIRGFFENRNGKAEKLGGFFVFDDIGKPIKIEQNCKSAPRGSLPGILRTALLCVLVVTTAVLATMLYHKSRGLEDEMRRQQAFALEMDLEIEKRDAAIAGRDSELNLLQSALTEALAPEKQLSAIEELIDRIESPGMYHERLGPVLQALKDFVAGAGLSGEGELRFIVYVVQPGDTLTSLCGKHGLEYAAYAGIIHAVNGITDPDRIGAGQVILLPVRQ